MASAWGRLPADLRLLPQWVVAGASKAPLTVGANGQLIFAKVNSPSDWMSFERAAQLAWDNRETVTTDPKTGRQQTGFDIGFVLNEDDPFTCIDLDVKDASNEPDPSKWTTPEQWDRFWRIAEFFGTYVERSRSGKGLHVWVRGNIGQGFRRDGVEVYSRERFIISTGDVVIDKPIAERQQYLTNMVSQMRPQSNKFELEELPQEEDDWSILHRAYYAANGEKFRRLWSGDWRGMDFPSQSEADLALMSMFTFYSPSNQQCRRLFWESGLGKREKAQRVDYINETLKTIRSRQAREVQANFSNMKKSLEEIKDHLNSAVPSDNEHTLAMAEITRLQGGIPPQGQQGGPTPFGAVQPRTVASLHAPGALNGQAVQQPPQAIAAQMEPVMPIVLKANEGISWPPGFTGAIAQFIYQSAPRPVKEVAIVGALGLLAGLCGKAWHIPKSGLNLYITLVARSAIGKEGMHDGISHIIKACTPKVPFFSRYFDFTEHVSGPALLKACLANSSFLHINSEWGHLFEFMAKDERGPMRTLRTQMTKLYQKSGPQAIVGGVTYSSAENSVGSVASVNYSMIGETTPQTFYEALTPSMMADGFMSRFLLIEYDGERPPQNEHMVESPSEAMVNHLCAMCQQAETMINAGKSMPLGRNEGAATLLREFERECDRNINSTTDESRRQMWNRAALKVLRVSALLAVADNHLGPCITETHVTWALELIRRDIAMMKRRLDSGDIGIDDVSRERKIVALIKDYLSRPIPASYKIKDSMRLNGIIPRQYLFQRVANASAFYNHKLGTSKALDDTINNMIANNRLMEVEKRALSEGYNYQGKAYQILHIPDYDALSKD